MPTFEYKNGRYFKDGEPFFFIGVDYQYYRDKRSNWSDRLDQIKAGGGNVITFYTPWRHHIVYGDKPGELRYDFTGETFDSRDVVRFMDLCREKGLYMVAKPGPFVHSELNIGGLPDIASPTHNPQIEPVRLHDQTPLIWEYCGSQMPSPNDPVFDAIAKDYLAQVGALLKPYADDGSLIGIQLLDETIYCTSNDPPWCFGYDAADMRLFHKMLEEKYGDVATYNSVHGTEYKALNFVTGPVLNPDTPVASKKEDLAAYMDWGEFQWRIRTDFYARYKDYLGIDLPYLTNFAGITPPIDENVPDAQEEPSKNFPDQYTKLYPEWWFSTNRVDLDADIYEYGMISWLGVAAYNIADASSEAGDLGGNEVFNRYINTARRRRGINMEENWGFSKLYHPLSGYPMIPFFQTLASIAGGCTGYVIFTGVCHGYWLDDLDAQTQKQYRTFPADAPIGENGETGPMYDAMKLLDDYFAAEGADFLKAEMEMDLTFLLVPEYAAISSWTPSEKDWKLPHAVPRVGTDTLEPAATILGQHGVNFAMAELPSLTDDALGKIPIVCLRLGFFLSEDDQQKLIGYAEGGGKLIISGELPIYNEAMAPCTVLKEFVETHPEKVLYSTGNIFADERALLANLRLAGWEQSVKYSEGLRAFVYKNGEDHFVFFFNFDREGSIDKQIEFSGQRLGITVGSKTCGVVRVNKGRIASYLVKGVNEFEDLTATVVLTLGEDSYVVSGDGSEVGLA